jgi:K+-sensing histidine kinase KdpD
MNVFALRNVALYSTVAQPDLPLRPGRSSRTIASFASPPRCRTTPPAKATSPSYPSASACAHRGLRHRRHGVSRETLDAVGGLIAIAVERARAVETLSRSEAGRESERLRNAILDSVTHQLRTPLTSITMAISSLRTDPDLLPEAREEMMIVIEEEAHRLNQLISQAVEMAELDTDDVKLELAQTDIGTIAARSR